jgi:hypothetical protein
VGYIPDQENSRYSTSRQHGGAMRLDHAFLDKDKPQRDQYRGRGIQGRIQRGDFVDRHCRSEFKKEPIGDEQPQDEWQIGDGDEEQFARFRISFLGV